MQGRGGRRRNRPQGERREDAELAAAGAAQRPEQVAVPAFVAVDDAAVGEDDLRRGELVAGEPVAAAEDAEAAAEHEPGDPDGRAAAGGDRDAVRLQRVVDVAQPRPGADRRDASPSETASIGLTSMRIPRVEERPAKQWPPERTARSQAGAAGEGDRLGDVGGRGAAHDGLRADVMEMPDRRPAYGLVPVRTRDQDVARDCAPEVGDAGEIHERRPYTVGGRAQALTSPSVTRRAISSSSPGRPASAITTASIADITAAARTVAGGPGGIEPSWRPASISRLTRPTSSRICARTASPTG